MSGLDYGIVLVWVIFIMMVSTLCRKLSRSVADYLSANRCAKRYLLCTSTDMGSFAVIFVVAVFQQSYQAGFAAEWWNWLIMTPVLMILPLTGWVQYRYRETRAQTMPEVFRIRYGHNFRIFSGILAFTAGILNYGIFPAVTANFFVHFCGMPESVNVLGLQVGTFPLTMAACLALALFVLFNGGQVSVMVTDFLQGCLTMMGLATIFIFVLCHFGLDNIFQSLLDAAPRNSRVNPFDQSEISDFNIWFFLMLAFNRMYSWLVWPSVQGYMSAAVSPHEAKMQRVLAQWSFQIKQVIMILLALVAWVVLNHPAEYSIAAAAQQTLGAIGNPDLQKQLLVPVTLLEILPKGLLGLFAALMVGAAVTTDNSFIHSWGGIFIQDVLAPIYGKRISQKRHIFILKMAVLAVAGFAFFWSMVFPLKQWIFMYFQITSSIYLSGASIALIGALYWKKGTAQGAWSAMGTGVILTVAGILLQQFWSRIPGALDVAPEFPINGVFVFSISAICSTVMYIVVSLMTCKEEFNMDKLLHRGQYAMESDSGAEVVGHKKNWKEFFGINREFSRVDKLIYLGAYTWVLFFFGLNVVCTAWNFFVCEIPNGFWITMWKGYAVLIGGVFSFFTIWFTIGGMFNLRDLVRNLRGERSDEMDDGFVS